MAKFYKSRYTAAQQDALLDIVEQGGSGGEGGSVDSWVYYDFSSLGMNLSSGVTTAMSANFTLIKVRRSNGVIVIGNLYWITTNIETENYSSTQLVAVGIDEGMKCVNGDETITIGEYYKLMEAPYEQYPRLTKEEFYSL